MSSDQVNSWTHGGVLLSNEPHGCGRFVGFLVGTKESVTDKAVMGMGHPLLYHRNVACFPVTMLSALNAWVSHASDPLFFTFIRVLADS